VRGHLEDKHDIDPLIGKKKVRSARKSVLDQQIGVATANHFFWKDIVEKFKDLFIPWIVYCHIAFFQLENQYFRELLLFLSPTPSKHLPKATKTIRKWFMNAFLSEKERLNEDLQRSRTRISISFNLWTSPNPYAILGSSQCGLTPKQRRHRRLRCLGHIINLCSQAFLMGRNCEKEIKKLEKHYQRGDYSKVEELWRKFGCLGRLHNLVRYIRLTPQRREEFAAIVIGGDL
jgi:hypothetical protein